MNDKAQQALQEYRNKVNNGEVAPSERKTLKEKWEQKPTLMIAFKRTQNRFKHTLSSKW